MAAALVGLGSNLGDRSQHLDSAVELLRQTPQVDGVITSVYHASQPAGGPPGQGEFLNAAARVETSLSPAALLAALQGIEDRLGRVRGQQWAERLIDLDLLLYDQLEWQTPTLTLPHPRMGFRRFVLKTAAEIAPDWVFPINGWTLHQLLEYSFATPKYLAIVSTAGDDEPEIFSRLATQPGCRLIRRTNFPQIFPVARVAVLENNYLASFALQKISSVLQAALVPAGVGWLVSDFWLPSGGSALADEGSGDRITGPAAILSLPRPRLVVILASGADEAAKDNFHLRQLSRQPTCGPVLWLSSAEPAAAENEVLAALQAID